MVSAPRQARDEPPEPEAGALTTDDLLPLVYDELRRLAQRVLAAEPAQTLQPTALVHEAYLRLRATGSWDSRAHFCGAAARAIRRILIDRARARGRLKRGGGALRRVSLDVPLAAGGEEALDLVALDDALARLAQLDPQKARVVELRFFGGLTEDQAAAVLGVSASTVARDWRFSRIWLHRELGR